MDLRSENVNNDGKFPVFDRDRDGNLIDDSRNKGSVCIHAEVEADDWNCLIEQYLQLLGNWTKQRNGFRYRSELQLRVVNRESFSEALSRARFSIILLRGWVEEIDVERTIRERTNLLDRRPQASRRRACGAEAPKRTCLVDRGHEFWRGGTRHRCLDDGVLNFEEI